MRRITSAALATGAAVLLTSTLAVAQGQIVDSRLTNVTFSGPVSVPGHTLAAGTYHFQLADSNANKNIVQIFDKDNHLVATLLAVPATRHEPKGDPVITFKETRSDLPPAVHYWYYAGESQGNELVYPRRQAQVIANASGEAVMSTDTDSNEANALKNSKVTSVSPENANAPAPQATTPPATAPTTTAPATTASTTPTTTAETTPTTTADKNTTQRQTVGTSGSSSLPKTASNLPEIGLIGLIALSAGFAVRLGRRIKA
jgi:outer membrane biosynthesis protein TonB